MATANQLQGMSGPLLDRLEVIHLSGYTLDEKEHIAQVLWLRPATLLLFEGSCAAASGRPHKRTLFQCLAAQPVLQRCGQHT